MKRWYAPADFIAKKLPGNHFTGGKVSLKGQSGLKGMKKNLHASAAWGQIWAIYPVANHHSISSHGVLMRTTLPGFYSKCSLCVLELLGVS